ncbi:glycosyltransferase [Patescibacteria group bacterium]|nr:glycosyltransferase [Patescibacteria group bacterium]
MPTKIPRILIIGTTLEHANIIPLLLKIKQWHQRVTFWGNQELKKNIIDLGIIGTDFDFIELSHTSNLTSSLYQFMFESFKRNILAISQIKSCIKNRFEIVYSISSVLDLVITPFFIKLFFPNTIWVTVFDNTVNLFVEGNKFVRLLAWLFYRLSLIFIKRADIIFASTPQLNEYLLENGFRQSQVFQTNFGIENTYIKEASSSQKIFDALFIGRLNPAKGIYDMLEVLRLIKPKLPNFKLAIMGSGDSQTLKAFKSRIQQYSLEKNISFLGYLHGTEKYATIKKSRFFLFLSRTESFGIALLEAVCSGLPALAYDLPAYKLIYHKYEIYRFSIGDTQAVAQKILELYQHKNFSNLQGEKLLGKYSWENIAATEYRCFRHLHLKDHN